MDLKSAYAIDRVIGSGDHHDDQIAKRLKKGQSVDTITAWLVNDLSQQGHRVTPKAAATWVKQRVALMHREQRESFGVSTRKKTRAQLEREIAQALSTPVNTVSKPTNEKQKVAYGLSGIDEDEWSWTVERLRPGSATWGSGSDTIAEGVE